MERNPQYNGNHYWSVLGAEIFIILPMCVALSKGKNPQGWSSTNSLQARKIMKIGELIKPQDSVAGRLIDKLKNFLIGHLATR